MEFSQKKYKFKRKIVFELSCFYVLSILVAVKKFCGLITITELLLSRVISLKFVGYLFKGEKIALRISKINKIN